MNKSATSSPKKVTFSDAKAGDRVWSAVAGWGTVMENDIRDTYPIKVVFDSGRSDIFRHDGSHCYSDPHKTLYWDEVKIVAPEKPLPDLPVDTKVIVWGWDELKLKKYFSHFENGKMFCFADGKTSWTADGYVLPWYNWEVVE